MQNKKGLVGPVEETISSEAPFGNVIYRSSAENGYIQTVMIPVSPNRRYRHRGWIRRISNDQTPSGQYYIGYRFYNVNKTQIQSGSRANHWFNVE